MAFFYILIFWRQEARDDFWEIETRVSQLFSLMCLKVVVKSLMLMGYFECLKIQKKKQFKYYCILLKQKFELKFYL